MDRQLKDKAIDIKGKDYVLVSDRIIYFNDTYQDGCIQTFLLSAPDADLVVFEARIWPDVSKPDRSFTGHSQAKWGEGMVNKTAAMENAETSAIGRALGMMGIGVIDSVASADEINKTTHYDKSHSDATISNSEYELMKGTSKKTGQPYEGIKNKKTGQIHWSTQPGYDELYDKAFGFDNTEMVDTTLNDDFDRHMEDAKQWTKNY